MEIMGLGYSLGSKIVSNQDILDRVRYYSQNEFEGDLDETLASIKYYLEYSGAKSRRWLAEGEIPLNLTCDAIRRALEQAHLSKDDIDLVIHVGVVRAFLEPGQSFFIAQAMEFEKAQCFDVLEACMSWTRGMWIAYNFIKNNAYKNVLIVNTEFCMMENGFINPSLFKFRKKENIYSQFAGLTVGDGTSATILSKGDNREWEFNFIAAPMYADLCNIPLVDNYNDFCIYSKKIGACGVCRFASWAWDMNEPGKKFATEMILQKNIDDYSWVFPHGHSSRFSIDIAKELGYDVEKFKWNTFPTIGNLAFCMYSRLNCKGYGVK